MGAATEEAGAARPLRIAIFTNNYLPRLSGVAVAVDFLERALRGAGHATLVVAPEYGEAAEAEAPRVRRVRSLLFSPDAAMPVALLDSPLAAVQRFVPDLIHTQHPFLLGVTGRRVARRLGLPLVSTFHTLYEAHLTSPWARQFRLPGILRARIDRYLRRCDFVVAPTEPIRRELERATPGLPPSASVPTGLDPSRFEPASGDDRIAIRRRLGLSEGGPLLVWAGRLTSAKRPDLAVDALAELVARGFDGALVFLGRGGLEDRLQERARTAGVADRVAFRGRLEQHELPRALAAGDLFLFTSMSDTQGIVLYEAWAAGLPIVAVDSLAARAVVEPEANGLRVEPDARRLADAVARVLADRGRFRAPFPWEVYGPSALAARWETTYREAQALHAAKRAAARRAQGPRAVAAAGLLRTK
jgi:glycosyltransferase involved in cell wall biosynthesis